MPTFLSGTNPRARREHDCDLCGGLIAKGEKYDAAHMLYDGRAYTFRTHLGCIRLVQSADRAGWEWPDDGWTNNDFEELIDQMGDDSAFAMTILGDWFDDAPLADQAWIFELVLRRAQRHVEGNGP